MNKTKKDTISIIKNAKIRFEKDGFLILGIFGSFARGSDDRFSDIDIAYKLDRGLFSEKYKDGFSKLLKIQDIKKEIENDIGKKVDLVSLEGKNSLLIDSVKKELLYV